MKSNVKKAMAAIAAAVVCAIPMTNAVTASAASGLRRDTGIRTAETASGTGMKGADAIPAATTTTGRARKVSTTTTTTTAEVTLGQSESGFTLNEGTRLVFEDNGISDRYTDQIQVKELRDSFIKNLRLTDDKFTNRDLNLIGNMIDRHLDDILAGASIFVSRKELLESSGLGLFGILDLGGFDIGSVIADGSGKNGGRFLHECSDDKTLCVVETSNHVVCVVHQMFKGNDSKPYKGYSTCFLGDGWSVETTIKGTRIWKKPDGTNMNDTCGNECEISKREHPDENGSCEPCKNDEEQKKSGTDTDDDSDDSCGYTSNDGATMTCGTNSSNDDDNDNGTDTDAAENQNKMGIGGGCPSDPYSDTGYKRETTPEEQEKAEELVHNILKNWGNPNDPDSNCGGRTLTEEEEEELEELVHNIIKNWGNDPHFERTVTAEEFAHMMEVADQMTKNYGDPGMKL